MKIVRVALDLPLSKLFDYSLDNDISISPGQRVLVSFGRKEMVGVAIECVASSALLAERIKPVLRVLDDTPVMPDELLGLLHFCSNYYHYPLGATVLAALPSRLRIKRAIAIQEEMQYVLSSSGCALDLILLPKRKVVQHRILAALRLGALSIAQVRALSSSGVSALKGLLDAGWVETRAVASIHDTSTFSDTHTLTLEQQQAVDMIATTVCFSCILLHGITGSGKTEVYVHAMNRILQQGGQVMLLVPEINLTPQLENYFRGRLPDVELVSLHSGLSDDERMRNWLHAQSGRARIILGTRLAVFAPLPRLALVIVDEEHDASFKQQDGLRYSARDVAIFRASQRDVPIVLGSATPSLESYYNAQSGRYKMLRLTQRAVTQAKLPTINCINIGNVAMQHGLSEPLMKALSERLQRGEQSLIFVNRRGYAPVLMCSACGWMSGCTNCAGKLVLHLKDGRLRCHHCGHQERVPQACPSCGNTDLQPIGVGTQRIESMLRESFPGARILRVDRDSTRNKGAWQVMRQQIQDNAVDILVGTQMLAKGHDFPNLTLVGVVNPDSALYSNDFRASEKLFSQLTQVAGRAGRADKPGQVLIQTAFPEHPLFNSLQRHDYDAWAKTLVDERKSAGFPPFVYQVLLRAEAKSEPHVYSFLGRAREDAIKLAMPVDVYSVVPAVMPRRANHFLAQLLVQSEARKSLQQFLREWYPLLGVLADNKLRWSLDIDPMDF
ncbi:MAG: primosomal protein N' [Candidatus Nitrotoga sp.]|jgi:primosomal protein N' (replication factor Y) (superfamily II helicase)|nr:primosomal protein N' [Candidatus Nitrotoga sp.]MDW7604547.1 primosomal protein N' [Candidatus Nitrotoga sp.]MDW7612624.1 primosomal protein N' [Candidatus Nitrotoga sp.]MDW7625063.1 primosomal protein N' [Candidatus Nitrotoga sp.]